MSVKEGEYVKWFSELSNKDVPIAGGKGASLAEMYNNGFPIPPGFMVTAQAYTYFLESAGLFTQIKALLSKLNMEDTAVLTEASKKIRALIDHAPIPKDLESQIIESYELLDATKKDKHKNTTTAHDILKNNHEQPFVAVRSSATTEDLAEASFAGQQDSFLGVKGKVQLIQKFKECCSSLFTARAIYYRQKKGFDHTSAQLAVVVQKMIDSQKSGVMFSKNPLKNDRTIMIEAVWGLGEGIVSGKILPDHYILSHDLELQESIVSDKHVAMVRAAGGDITTVKLKSDQSSKQVLTAYELKRLAQYALQLEDHYGKPQDIEFAIDDEIYIVQSRPITTKASTEHKEVTGTVLLSGLGASPGVGSGAVRIVHTMEDLPKVKKGDVLVTMMTNPDMVVSMERASGIVTDEGGITSHAAIISREMGIPAVVGTKNATKTLKDGQIITVDGSTGRVLDGRAAEKKVEILPIVPTRTKIKVIVDIPEYAQRAALSKSSSVGLVRLEGIIGTSGKHPVWYITNNKIKDYIASIHQGLRKIALHFDEMCIRTSDIRSDEYRNLQGAPQTTEGNPMLGNHGIRFSLKNIDLLEAEITAIKELADEFPKKVFEIMMPQIISVEEVSAAKKIADQIVLPNNVKLGIMVETPAAVQIIEELCQEGIEFISFGTNDLTQYTLAIDRNNPDVQDLYTEMHPAVLRSLQHVIRTCKKYGVLTSICGQAASREDMATFLVKEGIDSLSVNADAAEKVSKLVAQIEQNVTSTPAMSSEMPSQPRSKHTAGKTGDKGPLGYAPVEEPVMPIVEEDIILKALEGEDEYKPGYARASDVPSLNDAIPIDSDHFATKKEDRTVHIS